MFACKNTDNSYLHIKIGKGVYETTFGQYLFDVEDSSGGKVKEYISSTPNDSFEKFDVNGTVFFLTNDNFKRIDNVWIILSGKDLSKEKLADFGKSINNWSTENGLFLNHLTIDYANIASHESYRLHADKKQLDDQNYSTLIKALRRATMEMVVFFCI